MVLENSGVELRGEPCAAGVLHCFRGAAVFWRSIDVEQDHASGRQNAPARFFGTESKSNSPCLCRKAMCCYELLVFLTDRGISSKMCGLHWNSYNLLRN